MEHSSEKLKTGKKCRKVQRKARFHSENGLFN